MHRIHVPRYECMSIWMCDCARERRKEKKPGSGGMYTAHTLQNPIASYVYTSDPVLAHVNCNLTHYAYDRMYVSTSICMYNRPR